MRLGCSTDNTQYIGYQAAQNRQRAADNAHICAGTGLARAHIRAATAPACLQPVEAHSLMMLPMLSDLHELYSLPLAPHHLPAGWDYPD